MSNDLIERQKINGLQLLALTKIQERDGQVKSEMEKSRLKWGLK